MNTNPTKIADAETENIKWEDISSTALAPLIEYAKDADIKTALADALTEKTGKKVHRQQVAGWLNPDPEQRVEPVLGKGLLLISIGYRLMGIKQMFNLDRLISQRCIGQKELEELDRLIASTRQKPAKASGKGKK